MTMTNALRSRLCTGILLLLLSASLAVSQMSLDTSPGNRTLTLDKPSKEVSTASEAALNNYGERKLPLESTATSSSSIINNSAKPPGFYNNKEEQNLESNHETISNTTMPPALINHDKSRHQEAAIKKHLIEKLIENSYVDETKAEVVPEFNEKEEYPDIEDNEEFGNKEPTTPKPNGVISLLNDTNVNFNNPKKEVNEDSTSTKSEKITQENATNVISKDAEYETKFKDPKSQVEIVKNTTYSKIQKIEEANKKIDKIQEKDANKTTDESFSQSSEAIYLSAETDNNTSTTIELVEPKNERNSSAKGRTISFGGINEFTNNSEEKAIDKGSTELVYTKELKPYPYLKTSTGNPLNVSKPVPGIEEISPLENTIGRSAESDKKIVITEPSVVIDNSIQQIKPTYYKRSGNSSRINTDPPLLVDTTTAAVTTENSRESTLDLSENVTPIERPFPTGTTVSTELPKITTTELPETRATEVNLVQNSTEKFPMETAPTFDIETSPGDSLLMTSPLNVTEETTEAPTTLMPTETTTIFSSSGTTITEETLATTTIDKVGTTTIIPETTTTITTTITSTNLSGSETESTTGRVEYEFVGLTETTDKNYEGSSELSTSIPSTTLSESIETTTPDNATREELTTTDFITEVTDVETTTEGCHTTEDTTLLIPETTVESGEITEILTVTTISMNPTSGSRFREETSTIATSTEMASSSSEDSSSTVMNTESTIQVVTDVPWSPEDVNVFVRIMVEGSWNDVCPHLQILRQALADLLTGGVEKMVSALQIIFKKNPCSEMLPQSSSPTDLNLSTLYLYVIDQNGNFDATMTRILPSLYTRHSITSHLNIRSIQLVQGSDSGNAIAVVAVSCVAFICLVLLAGLLFIMRKRQTRFNYGERCRPVSLDAFSLDSVSAYNSVRRKGANRASKRSYGNPTFEDSTAIPSHPLNFAGLSAFCNEQSAIYEEYSNIPQVSAKIDELPPGAEVKNRYANVVPLPETRVPLAKINNDPLSEYINASYVRGPKNATKYYIACQAPMESTVTDFWRMIWEQQCKVIIMLTDLIENGVEKCAEYVPPSEVTDCHRLYGDFQVTLKKRETKEKYAISTLHLKNLDNNTYREISHIWYLWPATGVQSDAAGLIAVLLEARALQRGGPVPIVVHCSPGTGRTGTLIALDLGIRQYEITRTIDVPRVVYTIRRDRAGSVQTKEQYAFIYKALNLYATKLAGGGIEST